MLAMSSAPRIRGDRFVERGEMPVERIIVGIDVGTTKICTLIGQVDDNGSLRVIGIH